MKIRFGKIAFILSVALLLLGAVFFYEYSRFNDGRLHVVFCDVGQGDAIYLRTPKGIDVLVDGGPNDAVLGCLSSHMPFWDRTIELVFLTHPHADHLTGLISVLDRYTVLSFNTENLTNTTAGFRKLTETIRAKKIKSRYVGAGDTFRTKDGLSIRVLGPTESFLLTTSPEGVIGESGEFGSLITLVSFGEFRLLLTGDSQKEGLRDGLWRVGESVDVVQVPHHGSKTGLDADILTRIKPRFAVISVGKKNRYGHPNKETLKLLGDKDTKIVRTDQNGEIEIISDGKTFWVTR